MSTPQPDPVTPTAPSTSSTDTGEENGGRETGNGLDLAGSEAPLTTDPVAQDQETVIDPGNT